MAISKRVKLESAMTKIINAGLGLKGYVHRKVEDENYFTRCFEHFVVEHTFHLSGERLYYCFSNTYLIYTDLGAEIAKLVPERGEDIDRFGLFGPSTSVSLNWPNGASNQLAEENCVGPVAESFLLAVDAVEKSFVQKYQDPEVAVAESRLFYTKWPSNMGPMRTALLLIAWGLRTQQSQLVAEGAERIDKKISFCTVEREREFMLAVRAAALRGT